MATSIFKTEMYYKYFTLKNIYIMNFSVFSFYSTWLISYKIENDYDLKT